MLIHLNILDFDMFSINTIIKYVLNVISILILIVLIFYEFENNKDKVLNGFNNNIQYKNANVIIANNTATKSIIPIKNDNQVNIKNIYKEVDESYFNNTLFIGDSRTVGFKIYKKLKGATYYCSNKFGVYGGFDSAMELDSFGFVTLEELLKINQFSKIYIWLGINNAPTNSVTHEEKFRNFINKIIELQPNAIIYLIANLHVTKYYGEDARVNNTKINIVNTFIKGIADDKKIFFLDPNFLYDNKEGALDYIYSADDMHIKVMYYEKFLNFLMKHAINTEKIGK